MKMNFRDDLALKIVSVLIAIGLWFYVVQVQSPDIERTVRDIPVVYTQKTLLENRGLVLLNDKEHTIDIKIRGKRKYVMDASNQNITILADVSSIDTTGEHTLYTNIILPYANLEIINQNPSSLIVEADTLATVKKKVDVVTTGEPKNDYVKGNVTALPETVTLKGPKTLLDGVASVAAELDIDGASSDVQAVVPLVIYGSNGKEIKSSYITADKTEIEARCEILKTKSVDITPVFSGNSTPESNGYKLDGGSLKQIKVAGPKNQIDSLTEIKTKEIKPSDIKEDGSVIVKPDLPAGIIPIEGNTFTLRFTRE